MDDIASHRSDRRAAPDLASIVLGDAPRRRQRSSHPMEDSLVLPSPGYDARSALVLAIVVAALAGVIGWSTTIGRQTSAPPAAPTKQGAATPTTPKVAPAVATSVKPAVPAGIDLAPGRITAVRSGAGGGIVRIAIANQGAEALGSERGAQVLVLLDGELVGERAIGAIDATGSATTELALESCPTGRHAVAVVVDPRGFVREADERDNAVTQSVAFRGC